MPTLFPAIVHLLAAFAPAFTRPTVEHALVLLSGTLLASGRRTVTAALRALGLQDEPHFTTYHRVLNRAVWSALAVSQILLRLLVHAFLAPDTPLVVAMDDHLERRYGHHVACKGRYHDAVRSALHHPITTTTTATVRRESWYPPV